MDYVQRIELVVKRLANSSVMKFFAKSLAPKGTQRCPTNGPYQQHQIDCRQTADVASGSGIQRGRVTSNVGHVRKQSDDLQRRFAIDPPASNTKCRDTHVQRTPGRTPDLASGPEIQRERKSLNMGHPCQRSDNLQRRSATDLPDANANGPVIQWPGHPFLTNGGTHSK